MCIKNKQIFSSLLNSPSIPCISIVQFFKWKHHVQMGARIWTIWYGTSMHLISAAFKVSSLHFFYFIEIYWCFVNHDRCSLTRFDALAIRNRSRSGPFAINIRFVVEIEKTCLIGGRYIWCSDKRICITSKWWIYQRYRSYCVCCENSWFQIQCQRLKFSSIKVGKGRNEGHLTIKFERMEGSMSWGQSLTSKNLPWVAFEAFLAFLQTDHSNFHLRIH